jgi:hypothetical protein
MIHETSDPIAWPEAAGLNSENSTVLIETGFQTEHGASRPKGLPDYWKVLCITDRH